MKHPKKPIDHSVKVGHETYLKLLHIAKEEQRAIRIIIDRAIENSFRKIQKQLSENTKTVLGKNKSSLRKKQKQ